MAPKIRNILEHRQNASITEVKTISKLPIAGFAQMHQEVQNLLVILYQCFH